MSGESRENAFSASEFYKNFEAVIEAVRKPKDAAGTEDLIASRDLSSYRTTDNIYDQIGKRIKRAGSYLKGSKTNDGNGGVSEKHNILSKYFVTSGDRPRIHVVQGPPGTGKTELSAIYILLYLVEWHRKNPNGNAEKPIIAVSAFTHKAIENVLLRIERLFPLFYALSGHGEDASAPFPFARMIKVHSHARREQFKGSDSDGGNEVSEFAPDLVFGARTDGPVDDSGKPLGLHDMRVDGRDGQLTWFADECDFSVGEKFGLKIVNKYDRPTIIGCTASQLIKLKKQEEENQQIVDFLLLDEASMMMLPDFLPLANKVKRDGHLVVVGDDLQLGPISKNNWSREIRPSLNEHKPWNSVFHYLRRMAKPKNDQNKNSDHVEFECKGVDDGKLVWSALQTTYRLGPECTKLIQPAYDRVGVPLRNLGDNSDGNSYKRIQCETNESGEIEIEALFEYQSPEKLSDDSRQVTLVTYGKNESDTRNKHEVNIIEKLLEQGLVPTDKGKNKKDIRQDIAIVTPYHDQINWIRSSIKGLFDGNKVPDWLLIDTVNKLQGDERDVIIFSASVSGEENLRAHGDFVMELQRTNVAFSRARKKLIVIASESLLNYIPHGFQQYNAALLWKHLRDLCVSS